VCEGEFHPDGGWLYQAVDLTDRVGFVFWLSASWTVVTDSVILFQVCFVDGDACSSFKLLSMRLFQTWKVDLRRLWWPASAGGFSDKGCALEWWKDLYVISLFQSVC
jgi:hypothetical protein